MPSIVKIAEHYGNTCHEATNHKYDGMPYSHHYEMTACNAIMYRRLLRPREHVKMDIILAACRCHDVIEDARQTYTNVKEAINEEVAEIVYAVTNEKGKDKKQREDGRYYRGIIRTPLARFVKICDRLANIQYSATHNNRRMLNMYRDLYQDFKQWLYLKSYDAMFAEMERLLGYDEKHPAPRHWNEQRHISDNTEMDNSPR